MGYVSMAVVKCLYAHQLYASGCHGELCDLVYSEKLYERTYLNSKVITQLLHFFSWDSGVWESGKFHWGSLHVCMITLSASDHAVKHFTVQESCANVQFTDLCFK